MNKISKKHLMLILGGLAVVATIAYAAGFERIPKDELILGSGTTDTKTMTFDVGLGSGNPKIRANNASPNLEFASDGASFLPFGSGSGGASGVNVLENGDFELGTASNWTASGGTFADEQGANLINGSTSASFSAGGGIQSVTSDQATLPLIADDQVCLGRFAWNGGELAYRAEVIDGSSNVLGGIQLSAVSKVTTKYIPFKCPTSDTVAFRVRSTSGTGVTIYFDDVFVGVTDRVRRPLYLASVDDPNAVIYGDGITLSDRRVLKTYDGAGTTSYDYGKDLTISLDTILGSDPADATNYSLCIDKEALAAANTLTDTGEQVVPVVEGSFVLLTDWPSDILLTRYVCLATIRSATTGNVWSGEGAYFDAFPEEIQSDPPIAINPVVYSIEQTVGSPGAKVNAKGALVDGDITFANSAYFPLAGDALNDATQGGDLTNNNVLFNQKGFFGRENVAYFNGEDGDLASSNSFFNPGDTDHSFGGWFYLPDWAANNDALVAQRGVDNSFHIFMNSGSIDYRSYENNSTFTACQLGQSFGAPRVSPGWHHVVAVYDASPRTMRLYFDGQQVCEATPNAQQANGTPAFTVGSINSSSDYAPMHVQDFFFTSDVLTSSEINGVYSKRYGQFTQLSAGHELTTESFTFSDLTGNTFFYNLGDLNDDSGNGENLTVATGAPTFDGESILGDSTTVRFDGNDSLQVPTAATPWSSAEESFFIGAWVSISNGSSASMFFDTEGSDIGMQYAGNGVVRCIADGTIFYNEVPESSVNPVNGAYHYWYFSYDVMTNNWTCSIDSLKVTVDIDPTFSAVTDMEIGRQISPALREMIGKIDELTIMRGRLPDAEELQRLRSTKLTHSKMTNPEYQEWVGLYTSEDGLTENQFNNGWIVHKGADDLYLDTGLIGGSTIELKLRDIGFTPQLVPVQKFNSVYSSDPCSGAECSIPHNLPGRPQSVEVWHEVNSGEWERQDPSTCQTTTTNLVCLFSGIGTIGASNRLNVIASMGDIASAFEGDVITTGAQTFSGAKTFSGEATFSNGLKLGAGTDTLTDYEASGTQSSNVTVTWTGTAPSGTQTTTWRYTRIGDLVNLVLYTRWSVAGSANTRAIVNLPAGIPTVATLNAGLGSGNTGQAVYGYVVDQVGTAPTDTSQISHMVGNNQVWIQCTSQTSEAVSITVNYFTDD